MFCCYEYIEFPEFENGLHPYGSFLDIDIVIMDTIPPTAANYLQRVGRAGRMGQSKAVAFSLCNNTPVGQNAFANPMWALQTMNHMIPVRSSQTIIQRHVNSFFFREFICGQGVGIQGTATVGEFMESPCDDFIEFLDDMSTNKEEEKDSIKCLVKMRAIRL